jgi:hypothetical protein
MVIVTGDAAGSQRVAFDRRPTVKTAGMQLSFLGMTNSTGVE